LTSKINYDILLAYANNYQGELCQDRSGEKKLTDEFKTKAGRIKAAVQKNLWDKNDEFFKTMHQKEDGLVAVKTREAIGFVPWYFNLPDGGYEIAWKHLMERGRENLLLPVVGV